MIKAREVIFNITKIKRLLKSEDKTQEGKKKKNNKVSLHRVQKFLSLWKLRIVSEVIFSENQKLNITACCVLAVCWRDC